MTSLCAIVIGLGLFGQPAANADAETLVQIDLPNDVEVKILAEYVAKRLGLNILYDEIIANKRLTLKAVTPVPVKSLQALLEAALKAKGLVLIDAEVPGWKRIVDASSLVEYSDPIFDEISKLPTGARPATLAFKLESVPVTRADQIIKPFLSKPGGSSLVDQEGGMLLVTDFAPNLLRIEKLLNWIDRPAPETTVRFVPIKNTIASELSPQLTQLLQARSRAKGLPPGVGTAVDIASDERTNQLVLIGTPELVDSAVELIDQLDVPLDIVTKSYPFRYTSASRIDKLVQQLISQSKGSQRYSSALDEESNLLIVNATADVHRRIEELKRQLDIATAQPQSPIRFYELKNASVDEVLATIRSIEGGTQRESPQNPNKILQRLAEERSPPPGPNYLPAPAGEAPPLPPVQVPETSPPTGTGPRLQTAIPPQPSEGNVLGTGSVSGLLGRAQVSSDPNTNTIIVVAEPQVQALYAELIRRLDRRRSQVLIEVTVVTMNCTDDFALGIELSGSNVNGLQRAFALTSYGLSQVNPITGALQIIPGTGFNGTLVDPEVASAVIRAVATHTRGRVVSAPKLLVNDNATGVLTSVNEFPFNSVNASTTVATTSFGGFADAGTTISISPRIGEGDFLELAITAELSSFTGAAASGLPPPRQNNAIESDVTVPDGHTVILGGLRFNTEAGTMRTVPFLEKIPVVKYLVSSFSASSSSTSIYFFIRPVILRDDGFDVLKYLSEKDLCKADLHGNHPMSQPALIGTDLEDDEEWFEGMAQTLSCLEGEQINEGIDMNPETYPAESIPTEGEQQPIGDPPPEPESVPVEVPQASAASKKSLWKQRPMVKLPVSKRKPVVLAPPPKTFPMKIVDQPAEAIRK